MSLSPEQIAMRRGGITATDVAAIVGVHPFHRPVDVFAEKTGQAEPFEGNLRTKWGDLLEQPIRDDYERKYDVRVELHGTLRNPRAEWQMATPDGLVFPRGSQYAERGLEIKCHGREAMWSGALVYGQPGTDEVPPHELIQCVWGMHVAGLDRWDLVSFYDGVPNEFSISRDDELIGILVEAAERFRNDHVIAGVPPPPDGSDSWDRFQKRRWNGLSPDVIELGADHIARPAIAELREVREQIASLELRRDAIGQTLKELIGDGAGLRWIDERGKPQSITWKRNKSGIATDWRAALTAARTHAQIVGQSKGPALLQLVELLQSPEMLDDVTAPMAEAVLEATAALAVIAGERFEAAHTVTVEGNRPFCVPRNWSRNTTDKN